MQEDVEFFDASEIGFLEEHIHTRQKVVKVCGAFCNPAAAQP